MHLLVHRSLHTLSKKMQKWLVPNKNGRGTVVDARTGPAEPATASTNVWDQHGLEVKRNAGAGNCGPLAVASALSSRWPEKYGDLTGVTVRAAVNAEMLDKPGKYAHSVAGCTFRHNNMTPNPGPIEIIDDAFKAYCAKKAKNGVDFDSVEMKAAAQVYPDARRRVFELDICLRQQAQARAGVLRLRGFAHAARIKGEHLARVDRGAAGEHHHLQVHAALRHVAVGAL